MKIFEDAEKAIMTMAILLAVMFVWTGALTYHVATTKPKVIVQQPRKKRTRTAEHPTASTRSIDARLAVLAASMRTTPRNSSAYSSMMLEYSELKAQKFGGAEGIRNANQLIRRQGQR